MTANRTKTIEYAWTMDNNERTITNYMDTTAQFISSNHGYDNVQIDILEDTDREFKSAYVVWGVRDNTATANYNNFSSCRLGLYISGTTGPTWYSLDDRITETDENISLTLVSKVTDWFISNFTGTSQRVGCICQFTNSGAAAAPFTEINGGNAFSKVVITYDYNDTSQDIRTKTVKIPIPSRKAVLPTSFTVIDSTEGVPALDTFLPESGKVYKDIFFEFWPNEGASTTTDYYLALKLDSEATAWSSARIEKALNSCTTPCFIWKRNDMDTSTTHTLSGRTPQVASLDTFGGILTVTYTYDHDNSSSIMNSLQLIVIDEAGYVDGISSRFASCYNRECYIEEPDPIAIKQSGYLITLNTPGAATFYASSMGQTQTAYTLTAGGSMAGFNSVVHSLTSGNKVSLHRGKNEVELNTYSSVSGRLSNLNGLLLLNYTSGKHSDGDGVHNHTIHQIYSGSQLDNAYFYTYYKSGNIPESDYYLNGIGYLNYMMTRTAVYTYGVEGKNLPSEHGGVGWETYGTGLYLCDGEVSNMMNFIRAGHAYKRFPKDSNDYQNFESAHDYRLFTNSVTQNPSMISLYTYHSITNDITGTVSGYTGDGSGIQVDLFECSTNKYLTSGITTAGGAYSITWYDDVWPVYTSAYQDSTHTGRSDKGT